MFRLDSLSLVPDLDVYTNLEYFFPRDGKVDQKQYI